MPSLLPFFEHHPNRVRNAPRFGIRLASSQPDSFCGKFPLHFCESPTDRFEMTRRTTYPTASQVRCRSRRPILLMHRQSTMNGYCNLHQKLHSKGLGGLLNESCNGCSRDNFPITGSEKKVQGVRSLIVALRIVLEKPLGGPNRAKLRSRQKVIARFTFPGGPSVHRKCVHSAHVHENGFSRPPGDFMYTPPFSRPYRGFHDFQIFHVHAWKA